MLWSMAIPAGMITRTIETAPICDALGKPIAGAKATLISERSAVWASNQQTFLASPLEAVTDTLGVARWELVPSPEQSGWIDGAGAQITAWTFTVSVATPPRVPDLPDKIFRLDTAADSFQVRFDVSEMRSAGIVTTVDTTTADQVRADAAAAEAAAESASAIVAGLQIGIPGGVARLEAGTGAVIDSAGRRQMRSNVLSWIATENGVVANTTAATSQQANLNAAAVALSAAGGGDLIILPGETIVTTGAYSGADNVRLVIMPGGKLMKESITSTHLVFFDGRKNVAIVGGGILDPGVRSGATNAQNRIRIRNSQNATIDGMIIYGGSHTVQIQSGSSPSIPSTANGPSDNIRVTNNRFVAVARTGIYAEDGAHRDVCIEAARFTGGTAVSEGRDLPSTNVFLDGNMFVGVTRYSTGSGTGPWSCIYMAGVQGGSANGNTILASDDTAVMLAGGCVGVEVDRTIATTQQVCIYVGESRSCKVTRSVRLLSLNDIPIHVHNRIGTDYPVGNHTVTDNMIVGADRNGIAVEGVSSVLVASNIIRSPGGGITKTTTITSTPTFIYSGSVGYSYANTGSNTIYVGDAGVTTSTGTAVAPGASYTYTPQTGTGSVSDPYVPGTPAYAVTAAGQASTVTRTLPSNYAAAIVVTSTSALRADNVSVLNNLITLGTSNGGASGVVGLRTVGDVKDFTALGNNIDSAITRQVQFANAFGAGANVQVKGRTDGVLYQAKGGASDQFFPIQLGAASVPA